MSEEACGRGNWNGPDAPPPAMAASAFNVAAGVLAVAVGVGCDRGASLATVAECVDAALRRLDAPCVVLRLASVAQKRDEGAIQALAATRGWPLHIYPAAELAQIPVANPSATLRRLLGTPAVAEAAALRAAGAKTGTGIDAKGDAEAAATIGDDGAALLVEKQTHRGADGKHATVAIARVVMRGGLEHHGEAAPRGPVRGGCSDG